MKCGIFLGSLSLLLVAPHEAAPVLKKVVSMLQGMKESSEKEKHEEEVQYASFSSWCEAELATKTRELGEAGDAAALLLAAGEDSEAKIAAGKAKLAELVKDLEKWEVEKENATLKRTKEASLYKETHQDYTESIQAILKASRSLKTSPSQGVSLLTKLPPHAAQKVAAFLAVYHSNLAPELDSLDFSSDRIEEMLNELRDRFSDERSKLEKEEMTLHHAHQSLMQELSTLISQAEAQQAELKQRKATEEKALGSSKSQLADAEASKKEMESYLSEVNQSCTQKAKDYKERQKLREGELSAIEKTIDLLSSQEIDRTQGRLSLTQRATALVSLSWPRSVSAAQSRAAEYLQNQAMKINSRVLFSMATRLSSASGTGADPMANVRKMLNNLITTLESESSEEMEHRDWCEKEMTANEKARDTRSSTVERLQTEMDSAEAHTAQLGAEITELQVQLSENAESVSNQTDARKLEKAENEKIVEDAKSATEAVAKAIEVLKNFYAGVAFIQSRTVKLAKAPEIFEGAYSPQGGDGVIAMLEVVQSDYSKLETTTAAQEVAAEKTFESLKSEMALLKVQQEKDLEHKKIQKGEKEQLIVGKKADLQNADKELTAALEYYEQLKDSCLATGSTAQERAARRAEEIQSLKEAMDLLEKGTQ